MKTFRILKITLLLFVAVFMASCEYEFIEPIPPEVSTDTIHFTTITPIFENTSCTDCHNSGSFDLTAANAYNTIMNNNFAVPGEPANSLIYTKPSGSHFANYSAGDADLIYNWILQGALNN